jgi:methyl-accepting chemotaxis protein
MKTESGYSLQRTMILYFLLIAFASILVGVEFLAETGDEFFFKTLMDPLKGCFKGEAGSREFVSVILHLRNKALLMIGIILFVTIIVLTMFIKNITEPLQHMIALSRKISKGDLSKTIRIEANNELSELGNVINETTSNLQEIILLTENIGRTGFDFLEKVDEIVKKEKLENEDVEKLRQEIANFKNELEMMKEVIDYFNFYTVM